MQSGTCNTVGAFYEVTHIIYTVALWRSRASYGSRVCCLLVTIQIQQLVLIGSGSLLRLWAGCTVVAFYEFIQGINLPASSFNRAIHTMILLVSRVLKRTPRTGLSREGPCAERDRRNPAVCSHRIDHFAASWRLLHQGWPAIGKYSQAGHALTRQDWVNKRISWRTPLRVCQGISACS